MTLEGVAKQIGVSRATVYKYETGAIMNIPADKIIAMAELFDVSKSFLMGWTKDEKASDGVVIPAIPVPDNEMFVKTYNVMSYDDRAALTDIFTRAYNKIQEMEKEKK